MRIETVKLNEGHHHLGPRTPGTGPLTPLAKMAIHHCVEALHEERMLNAHRQGGLHRRVATGVRGIL